MALPSWLFPVRKFLGALTDILTMGRKAGLWSQGAGPQIPQRFVEIPPAQPLIGGLKAAVKGRIVKAGLDNIKHSIDTPEERRVIVAGIHVPGIPESYAWLLAMFAGLAEMILAAVSASDTSLLLTDWQAWLNSVLISVDWSTWLHGAITLVGAKLYLWIKQDSHNSTAVLKAETVSNIAEVIQK